MSQYVLLAFHGYVFPLFYFFLPKYGQDITDCQLRICSMNLMPGTLDHRITFDGHKTSCCFDKRALSYTLRVFCMNGNFHHFLEWNFHWDGASIHTRETALCQSLVPRQFLVPHPSRVQILKVLLWRGWEVPMPTSLPHSRLGYNSTSTQEVKC